MDLTEIVNRQDKLVVQQEEAFFVINRYIMARKQKDIQPKINTSLGGFSAIRDVQIMNQMLVHAIQWFRENEDEMKKVS